MSETWQEAARGIEPWPGAARTTFTACTRLDDLLTRTRYLRSVVGQWKVNGWTSRLDLAQKLASQQRSPKYGGGALRDVRILPVEREGA